MPDPRAISYGGEVIIGYKNGSATSFDPFGRRPWQIDYNIEEKTGKSDFYSLEKFKGEFASLFGPKRRGRSFSMCALDNVKDSDEYHKYPIDQYRNRSKKIYKK